MYIIIQDSRLKTQNCSSIPQQFKTQNSKLVIQNICLHSE